MRISPYQEKPGLNTVRPENKRPGITAPLTAGQ
jgi:hypothetical protein